MRIRIKAEEELVKIGEKSLFTNSIHFNSFLPFVENMFKYCNKTFNVEKSVNTLYRENYYRIIESERKDNENWMWENWMFDILPIIDEKKNYLLEF